MTTSKKCIICGEILTEKNKSIEHIINNSLGGQIKNENIYCKNCNEKFWTDIDTRFSNIFSPIISKLNINKRKTKGMSYKGIMIDEYGNRYTAIFKNGKVVKLEDSKSNYVRYENGKYELLYYIFDLDNKAFKQGLAKIAFNYAIHNNISLRYLGNIFDFNNKTLKDNSVIIPYIPLTEFDIIMENDLPMQLFHALRIFNNMNYLYAYIELFNTFQYYVLLSDNYKFKRHGDIDISDGNIIESYSVMDNDLLDKLTPKDFKDADIIATQYKICIKETSENLKKYKDYKNGDIDILFKKIGKIAYEKIRKRSYVIKYEELVNNHFKKTNFLDIIKGNESIKNHPYLISDFQFYTDYQDDCVNVSRYKKILPDMSSYPQKIIESSHYTDKSISYCHHKYYLLEKRLSQR